MSTLTHADLHASVAIGVDVGGTFTDVVVFDEHGQLEVAKVVTTPHDPREGVRHGVEVALALTGIDAGRVSRFVHGTTLATNVLLERKGARTAFVTTAGFGDLLRLGREHRVGAARYDLLFPPPTPPVEDGLTFEVHERLNARGEPTLVLSAAECERVSQMLAAARPEAVAICFLHSYANPEHERAMAAAVRTALPGAFVVASADVWPEMREFERASTAVACAYVGPVMADYLLGLQTMLREIGVVCPVQVMESSGGVLPAALVARKPVATIESGGAAGVTAAAFLGGLAGAADVLSFDMGGTTAKTAVVRNGQPALTFDFRVGESASMGDHRGNGLVVRTPVVDMAEIGAGGGSIAWVDAGGALQVGPRSAGAVPGPACYGRGGTLPTVTDANLVLGYLPLGELSDGVRLSVDAATQAIAAHIAQPLSMTPTEAANAIHEIVNNNMAAAIRMVTIQRGIDPRELTLVGFGGAGPIHIARLAEAFDIPRVIVPWGAGVASAVGLVAADPTVTEMMSRVIDAANADPVEINAIFADLDRRAAQSLEADPAACEFVHTIDARYPGQVHQLGVRVPAVIDRAALEDAAERFHGVYKQTYGVDARAPVQFVTYRVRGSVPVAKPSPSFEDTQESSAPFETRQAYFDGSFISTPVYRWEPLSRRDHITGPAIIEGAATSIIVPPGWVASLDATRSVVLARVGG